VKLSFVYSGSGRYWRDGLRAALSILEKDWDIEYYNFFNSAVSVPKSNFTLVWGAFGSPQVSYVAQLDCKKGICVAGGQVHPDVHKFDVVFVETLWHIREFRKIGIDAKLAFGTNTALFVPIPEQKKAFRAIYPAAFARWKRHQIFAKKYGRQGLAVGYIQPNGWEYECVEVCLENGVTVLPMVTPEVLVWLYNASKRVHITSDIWGGGERAVLEGLACGLDVRVEKDNPKLVELLAENKKKLWTESDYAKALKEGIEHGLNS